MDSKKYAWRYCTTDQVLSRVPCELIYFCVSPSAGAAECTLYHGTDATGQVITPVYLAVQLTYDFRPAQPVYCPKGLFIDIGANVAGVLVQYRLLGNDDQGE